LSLTGQRRQEIGGLRWSEVDEGQTRLDLPGWRMKNGLPHLVPLSSAALELLRATPRTTRDGDPRQLVFGRGSSGFRGWSHAKQQLDIRLAKKRAARAGAEIELPSRGEAPAKDQWRLERATLKALERFRLPVWRLH